jgi:uncharacterized protein (DUF2336 family)
MTMSEKLSVSDVRKLLEDPSADNRSQTAKKVAAGFGDGVLSERERTIAEDIFKVMVRDVEVRVREALSVNLQNCAYLSHDIARALAEDVDSVALPMLQFSTVLTDDDLVEIVANHGSSKQNAVAKRETVSEVVSEALVDAGDATVVSTLMSNKGARIAEPTMEKALDKHGDSVKVSQTMALRPELPISVAERLVSMVSDSIRDHILKSHDLPAETVTDLIVQSREKATIGLLNEKSSTEDARDLVVQLYQGGRLTPSIILRALCLGDIRFFEAAVAVLAKVPLISARTQIHDSGADGLKTILDKARVPKPLFPAFRAAVEVSHETDYDGLDNDRERFRRRMIERILTNFEDPKSRMGQENIDYLFDKLREIDPEMARLG